MTQISLPRPTRAPRANFRGTVTVLVQLENLRRIPAKLHQLSVTGGLLELTNYQEERSKITLTIPLDSETVRPRAEMLFPMRTATGYSQPFRFTFIRPEELQLLEKKINELLKHVSTPAPTQKPDFRHPRFYLETF